MKRSLIYFLIVIAAVFSILQLKSKKEQPTVVIMLGPPGAGKGTHAKELSYKLHLPHISTGDLFRENIKKQTKYGKEAKTLIDNGQLAPDSLVIEMLFDHIKQNNLKKGYILDGFPRTINQAEILNKKLHNKAIVKALNLQIDDALLIDRITNRLVCSNCGCPFHKTYLKPKVEGKCDKCKAELYQRKDDTEEVVRKRIEIYHAESEPLIEYYKNQNILNNIDSTKQKDEVLNDLLKAIKD